MTRRISVNAVDFAHFNPVSIASRIGQHLYSGVLTPHAGNATAETRHEIARDAVENAVTFAAGDQLQHVVE